MVSETKLELCPFSEKPLLCDKAVCGDCQARIEAAALVNQRIAENMEDFWKHQCSGAV